MKRLFVLLMMICFILGVLGLQPAFAGHKYQKPNIILITADDYGTDASSLYTTGDDVPPTPTIEKLADKGVVFNNAWATPGCTPTRGTIMTGILPTYTGIVFPLGRNTGPENEMDIYDRDLLPKLLKPDYTTALIGKFHLTQGDRCPRDPDDTEVPIDPSPHCKSPNLDPNTAGFDYWAGFTGGAPFPPPLNHYLWPQIINGEPIGPSPFQTTFTATEEVDQSLYFIQNEVSEGKPYFLWLSFAAPHFPYSAPPADLVHDDDVKDEVVAAYNELNPSAPVSQYEELSMPPLGPISLFPVGPRKRLGRALFNALVSAMDTEIHRLLMNIDLSNTYVIFIGDNGTSADVVVDPFDDTRAKTSLYEAGIKVPLVIAGPCIKQPGRTNSLFASQDIYATVLQLAGVQNPTRFHSVSAVPALKNLDAHFSVRDFSVTEMGYTREDFDPTAFSFLGPTIPREGRAIRNHQFKLIAQTALDDDNNVVRNEKGEKLIELEMYDLKNDPMEEENLLEDFASMDWKAKISFKMLYKELERLFKDFPEGVVEFPYPL